MKDLNLTFHASGEPNEAYPGALAFVDNRYWPFGRVYYSLGQPANSNLILSYQPNSTRFQHSSDILLRTLKSAIWKLPNGGKLNMS